MIVQHALHCASCRCSSTHRTLVRQTRPPPVLRHPLPALLTTSTSRLRIQMTTRLCWRQSRQRWHYRRCCPRYRSKGADSNFTNALMIPPQLLLLLPIVVVVVTIMIKSTLQCGCCLGYLHPHNPRR